jgi:hypothetical protein
MARTWGVSVLECPKCQQTMRPVAVITRHEVVDRILAHLRLPLSPELLSDGSSVGFDVTGEPVPRWVVGTDPEPHERGPPDRWDGIDPPAPEE